MRKRIYRSEPVKVLGTAELQAKCQGADLVFGLDVAKVVQYGSLTGRSEDVLTTVKWRHPDSTKDLIAHLQALGAASLVVVMESSGTYGDALRERFEEAGIPVYRASTKSVKDSHEIYDGVPSRHDAKCAAVLSWLHLQGKTKVWRALSKDRRQLRALVDCLDVHEGHLHRHVNRLEAMLARYWPEVLGLLELKRASLLELLKEYGGPAGVREDRPGARALLKSVGGYFLKEEKIEAVLHSAAETVGVQMLAEEEELLRCVATETRRAEQKSRAQRRQLEAFVETQEGLQRSSEMLGRVTAGVVQSFLGKPEDYDHASSYVKAAGLNLAEISSGQRQGGLHLSKRGSGPLRRWLFLAALRLIQRDSVVKAWYAKKVERDGGVKMKAVCAVMRKMVKALWHVGQGEEFDSRRLFDVSRLNAVA